MKRVKLAIDGVHEIPVRVANTIASRAKGLQGIESLDGEGMIFVYPKPDHLSFWMKDTNIPLDIAFLSKQGVIKQIEAMKPKSLDSVKSIDRCYMALEVPQGYFKERDIDVGSYVEFLGEDMKESKKSIPFGTGMKQVKTKGPEKEIIGHTWLTHVKRKDSSLKEVGEVLWHSLDEQGNISVYDVLWPNGMIETNVSVQLLEAVREGSHNESEAHGVQKENTALSERKYKKLKTLSRTLLRKIIKEELTKIR